MHIKQINNIRITRGTDGTYRCRYDGRVYEEFRTLTAAEEWCRETRDFVVRRKEQTR